MVSNTQIAAPSGIVAVTGQTSISISTALPADTDYHGTKFWLETNSSFDPLLTVPKYDGPANSFVGVGLTGGQQYYYRIAHYDMLGQDGLNISPATAITPQSPGGGVEIVSVLPSSGNFEGRVVFLDTDGKLYRYHSGAWTTAVATADLSGQIVNGQLAANSVTTDALVAGAVTAAKVSVTTLAAINANLGTIIAGNMTLDAAGFIRGGQTAYNTGTGFWLGYSGAAYRFSLGVSNGNRLTWDGSALSIVGNISASTITGGSININDKFTVDSSGNATIKSATTGARVEMYNNVIKVFDASNVLRVKIGDLTA